MKHGNDGRAYSGNFEMKSNREETKNTKKDQKKIGASQFHRGYSLRTSCQLTPSKPLAVDGACSSKFRFHALKNLPGTDCSGPVDYRIQANPVRPISFQHIAESDSRVLDMQTTRATSEILHGRSFPTTTSYPWFSRIRNRFSPLWDECL